MQLKLLVGVALLSSCTLLAEGRVVDLERRETSLLGSGGPKIIDPDVFKRLALEPRMFKKIKVKASDAAKKKKLKGKEKAEEGEGSTAGEARVPAPPKLPPPRYAGDPPNGMTEGDELEYWNRFVEADVTKGNNPPVDGGYLMYSGPSLKDSSARQPFKNQMEDAGNGKLHDWTETYRGTEAWSMWADYERTHPQTKHISSYALSWGQARRASMDREELAILMESKAEPLMKENTYWGAVEAGIITGPDSRVNQIWRYNADELDGDDGPDPTLAWDREVHEPFGKTDNDWRKNPRDPDVPENAMMEARPKGSRS